MELPLSIFFGFIAFGFSLPIFGLIFRMQIPMSLFMFIAGMFLIAIMLNTDSILVPEEPEQRVTTFTTNATGGTILENKTPFDFSFEGPNYQIKAFMIFISAILILGGVMIEVKNR